MLGKKIIIMKNSGDGAAYSINQMDFVMNEMKELTTLADMELRDMVTLPESKTEKKS